MRSGKTPEEFGIINQKGLNRKVWDLAVKVCTESADLYCAAHFRLCQGESEASPSRLHRCPAMYASVELFIAALLT